jgi:hypothetical protein
LVGSSILSSGTTQAATKGAETSTDLSEFVDETLSEIPKGVSAAQAKAPDGMNVNAKAASIPAGPRNVVNANRESASGPH